MYDIYDSIAALIGLLAAVWVITLVLFIVAYFFYGFGLSQMAKNRGIEHHWFAWIPFVRYYLIGEIIGDQVPFGDSFSIPYAKWLLTFVPIAAPLLGMIPYVGWVLSIAVSVYLYAAYFRLFKLYDPDHAVLYLVLSIIFCWVLLLIPIFIFVLRNKTQEEYLPQLD